MTRRISKDDRRGLWLKCLISNNPNAGEGRCESGSKAAPANRNSSSEQCASQLERDHYVEAQDEDSQSRDIAKVVAILSSSSGGYAAFQILSVLSRSVSRQARISNASGWKRKALTSFRSASSA
jgi:hypothetical protein